MPLDPLIEDMLNKNPLIGFSIYTDIQSRTIRSLGQDILSCLDSGITPDDGTGKGMRCEAEVVNRGYGQFWLWVIGAYEVVRTMCQAERCFSPRVATELKGLKRRLAVIRMPFAKQELPGKRSVPVHGEPSITSIKDSPPDLQFDVEGQMVSVRSLIDEFTRVFAAISRSDVLASHRTTYSPGA